ncbi:MAG: hypothetical protein KDK90_27025 [Leptospiraceae bacterium]|nr:hypothetical protein [Leptospiraceae bacterium]
MKTFFPLLFMLLFILRCGDFTYPPTNRTNKDISCPAAFVISEYGLDSNEDKKINWTLLLLCFCLNADKVDK